MHRLLWHVATEQLGGVVTNCGQSETVLHGPPMSPPSPPSPPSSASAPASPLASGGVTTSRVSPPSSVEDSGTISKSPRSPVQPPARIAAMIETVKTDPQRT